MRCGRPEKPGAALLRKCINPLWYFHPQAAKYRGLSEGDAAVATACAEGTHPDPSFRTSDRCHWCGNPSSPWQEKTDCHVGLRPPRNDSFVVRPLSWAERNDGNSLCPMRQNCTAVFPQPPSEAQLPASGRRVGCANIPSKNARSSCIFRRRRLYCWWQYRKATVSRLRQQAIWKRSFFMCQRISDPACGSYTSPLSS